MTKYYGRYEVNQALQDWNLKEEQIAALKEAEGHKDFFIVVTMFGNIQVQFLEDEG